MKMEKLNLSVAEKELIK
jgi:hypothetical protein